MIHMRTYSGYICTKQAFRHTFVTLIVSDDVRLVYCQHKVCSMQSSKPVSPGHFITSLSPLCVCWRRRSFSCVVSNTESVTSSSLSSSPTFGRLVFLQLTKWVMWAPKCMSPLYPVTYSSLLCVCWHRGSLIRKFR